MNKINVNAIAGNIIEFYITNVCNLACNNCNRFNNYNFTGWQSWEDYKDIYTKWGKKIDLSQASILGGEPTLNPTFIDWINGIREIWPTIVLKIVSNGTYFPRNLYKNLVEHKGRTYFRISIHQPKERNTILGNIKNFLQNPRVNSYYNETDWAEHYQNYRGDDWPETCSIHNYNTLSSDIKAECENFMFFPELYEVNEFVDENNIKFLVESAYKFNTASITRKDGKFVMSNSNVQKAHDICYSKFCHHFYKGKLYKCMIPALVPDFDDQFGVDLAPEDREMLNGYRSLEHSDSLEYMETFMHNLKKPISQCKLCPESFDTVLA